MKKLQFNYNPAPISVENLRKLFKHLSLIKINSNRIAILDTLMFNGGQIIGSDLENTVILKAAFFTGSGCIDTKVVIDTFKNCGKNDMVFIMFKGQTAEIYVNDILFISLKSEDVGDYPNIFHPRIFEYQYHVTSVNFNFKQLANCIGKDVSRLAMMNIKFGNGMAVATNAQVLKWLPIPYTGDDLLLPSIYTKLDGSFDFYISQFKVEKEIVTKVPVDREYEDDEETEFVEKIQTTYEAHSYIIAEYNNECVIVTRECKAQYPDYKAVIPTDNPNMIVVETSLLKDAIKKVSLCSNHTNLVVFTMDKMNLKVSAMDIDQGKSASVDIPLFLNNVTEIKQMGFDYKYLLSNLEDRKTTKMTYSTQARASIWNDNMLIMPLAIASELKTETIEQASNSLVSPMKAKAESC